MEKTVKLEDFLDLPSNTTLYPFNGDAAAFRLERANKIVQITFFGSLLCADRWK